MDLEGQKGWFLWLQEWLLANRIQLRRLKQETLTVEVPASNELLVGLNKTLRSIARWESPTQLILSLLDCARVALFSGNIDVVTKTASLIKHASYLLGSNGLKIIIDAVIAFGEASWRSYEGWELSQALFSFCREAGDLFTHDQVLALVVRDETYSRTGALGLLYDNFPEHTRSLDLPNAFKSSGDMRLWYYCKLRERYLGKNFCAVSF